PPETELSRQMTTSTTSIDIMGLQAAYANLHTDQERDYFMQRFAFDADPKFFACLVRFESSSVPTTLPTAYDVYPLDGRHDGGYYTVKDCVTIDVLPRTPGNNVYVGFMVWSNFTATK